MIKPALAAAAVALAATSLSVLAHEGATGVVAQRMASMESFRASR